MVFSLDVKGAKVGQLSFFTVYVFLRSPGRQSFTDLVEVVRTGEIEEGTVVVNYWTTGGTATMGVDFEETKGRPSLSHLIVLKVIESQTS